MKYYIQPVWPFEDNKIEIEESEFILLQRAKTCLLEGVMFQEKMQYVRSNYVDFETYLLTSSLSHLMGELHSYSHFQNVRSEFNKRIANLFSSARAYLDHSKHHLNVILSEITDSEFFTNEARKHYDESFSYRAVEALRNYTQHRGFPVHLVSFRSSKVAPDQNEARFRFTIEPKIRIKELSEDKVFKPRVLKEMLSYGDNLTLTSSLREYVERLSEIHYVANSRINVIMSNSMDLIEKKIQELSDFINEDVKKHGLYLTIYSSDEKMIPDKIIVLFTELIDRYKFLLSINKPLKNLNKRYVTGEILE